MRLIVKLFGVSWSIGIGIGKLLNHENDLEIAVWFILACAIHIATDQRFKMK